LMSSASATSSFTGVISKYKPDKESE